MLKKKSMSSILMGSSIECGTKVPSDANEPDVTRGVSIIDCDGDSDVDKVSENTEDIDADDSLEISDFLNVETSIEDSPIYVTDERIGNLGKKYVKSVTVRKLQSSDVNHHFMYLNKINLFSGRRIKQSLSFWESNLMLHTKTHSKRARRHSVDSGDVQENSDASDPLDISRDVPKSSSEFSISLKGILGNALEKPKKNKPDGTAVKNDVAALGLTDDSGPTLKSVLVAPMPVAPGVPENIGTPALGTNIDDFFQHSIFGGSKPELGSSIAGAGSHSTGNVLKTRDKKAAKSSSNQMNQPRLRVRAFPSVLDTPLLPEHNATGILQSGTPYEPYHVFSPLLPHLKARPYYSPHLFQCPPFGSQQHSVNPVKMAYNGIFNSQAKPMLNTADNYNCCNSLTCTSCVPTYTSSLNNSLGIKNGTISYLKKPGMPQEKPERSHTSFREATPNKLDRPVKENACTSEERGEQPSGVDMIHNLCLPAMKLYPSVTCYTGFTGEGPNNLVLSSCPKSNAAAIDLLKSYVKVLVPFVNTLLQLGYIQSDLGARNAVFQLLVAHYPVCCMKHLLDLCSQTCISPSISQRAWLQQVDFRLPSIPPFNLSYPLEPPGLPYNMYFMKLIKFYLDDTSAGHVMLPAFRSAAAAAPDALHCISVIAVFSAEGSVGPGLVVFPWPVLTPAMARRFVALGWGCSASRFGNVDKDIVESYVSSVFKAWLEGRSRDKKNFVLIDDEFDRVCATDIALYLKPCTVLREAAKTVRCGVGNPVDGFLCDPLRFEWGALVRLWKRDHFDLSKDNFGDFFFWTLNKVVTKDGIAAYAHEGGFWPIDKSKMGHFCLRLTEFAKTWRL